MEILSRKEYKDLFGYIASIRPSLKQWQMVSITLVEGRSKELTVDKAAEMVHTLFNNREGKIYVCDPHNIVMLIRWGEQDDPLLIPKKVESRLPPGSSKVTVRETTLEGLKNLEILIEMGLTPTFTEADIRFSRKENVVLIADDDVYMRLLVKKALPHGTIVHETGSGSEVLAAYKKYIPDITFLDIHLPEKNGTSVLPEIMGFDKSAYIIMLSADSSLDNVARATQKGAKGFMAKPFTKDRLMEFVNKCPSFSVNPPGAADR